MCSDISPAERDHVLSIMSKGVSYLPEDGPSATQLLQFIITEIKIIQIVKRKDGETMRWEGSGFSCGLFFYM